MQSRDIPWGTFGRDSVTMTPTPRITVTDCGSDWSQRVHCKWSQMWVGRAGAPQSQGPHILPPCPAPWHPALCHLTVSVDGRPGWLRDATGQTDAFGPQALEIAVLELEWWDTMKPEAGKRISRLGNTGSSHRPADPRCEPRMDKTIICREPGPDPQGQWVSSNVTMKASGICMAGGCRLWLLTLPTWADALLCPCSWGLISGAGATVVQDRRRHARTVGQTQMLWGD